MTERRHDPRDDEFAHMAATADRLGLDEHLRPVVERVELAGLRGPLSALRWGVASPQVVLLHGGGQNAHTWDNVLFRLGGSAIALDLPGHGRSSWYPEPDYLPAGMAADLAPAVGLHAPDARAVVGMSMGGFVAAALASRHPELVRRLVLIDVSPSSTPERSAEITEFMARDSFESFGELLEHARMFRPGTREDSLRRSLAYNAHELPDGRWTWRHDRRETAAGDRRERMFEVLERTWDDLAGLRCPTTLVVGGDSTIVTADDIDRYRLLVSDLDVVVVEGAGHHVQGDAPEEVTRVIASVLTRR